MAFPVSGLYRQSFTFRDAKGQQSTVRFFCSTGAGAVADLQTQLIALETALKGLTNAAEQSSSGPVSRTGTKQYGTSGSPYQDVQQKAVMTFQDSVGGLHRFQIPAPVIAAFLADQQTIDPANGNVTAFIAAMTGNTAGAGVVTRSGLKLTNFFGGLFAAKPIPKARSMFVLDANLTPQEPEE